MAGKWKLLIKGRRTRGLQLDHMFPAVTPLGASADIETSPIEENTFYTDLIAPINAMTDTVTSFHFIFDSIMDVNFVTW